MCEDRLRAALDDSLGQLELRFKTRIAIHLQRTEILHGPNLVRQHAKIIVRKAQHLQPAKQTQVALYVMTKRELE